MSINFENLPIKDFLKYIKNISEFTVSTQADGIYFYFGLDDESNFYSSPFSPDNQNKFFYDLDDYELSAENVLYRNVHSLLNNHKKIIENELHAGEAVQCQISAVEKHGASKNKLIIIRGIKGLSGFTSKDQIKSLIDKLPKEDQVNILNVDTIDGEELVKTKKISKWFITSSKHLEGHKIVSSSVTSLIDKLHQYLQKTNHVAKRHDLDLSNYDVLTINLIKIPEEIRNYIKDEREKQIDHILKNFKLPIKNELITNIKDQLKTKSSLLHNGSDEINLASDDFVAGARFDTIAKRQLSGVQRTADNTASIEDRGGLRGVALQRISALLGVPDLSRIQSAKKAFALLKGTSPVNTAELFAHQLKQLSFNGVKMKILAILKYTREEIAKSLEEFKQNATSFEMKTGEGESIEMTPAAIKQNLLQFAQQLKEIDEQIKQIKASHSFADIILVIYSEALYGLFGEKLKEEIIHENHSKLANQQLEKLSAEQICNTYCAVLLASAFLIRVNDKLSIKLLKDSSNVNKHSTGMSVLNYWGYIAFNPMHSQLKNVLSISTINELKKLSGRLVSTRIKKLHHELSSGHSLLDWDFVAESIKLITTRMETRGQSINMIINAIRNWDDLTLSDKNIAIAKIFYYLQAHDSSSILLQRIRAFSIEMLTKANKEKTETMSIKENSSALTFLQNLSEDEMNINTVANATSVNGTTSLPDFGAGLDPSNAGSTYKQKLNGIKSVDNGRPNINQIHTKFMNGKPIIRKKRDYVKKHKFARFQNTSKIQEDDAGDSPSVDSMTTASSSIATYPTPLFKSKKGSKKKKMLKRIFPLSTTISKSAIFSEMIDNLYSIELVWNDTDYLKENEYQGFNFIKSKYGIASEILEEHFENKWPLVKLIGNKDKLISFCINEYGVSQEFVDTHIKLVFGE